jgi:hypothetical protein
MAGLGLARRVVGSGVGFTVFGLHRNAPWNGLNCGVGPRA